MVSGKRRAIVKPIVTSITPIAPRIIPAIASPFPFNSSLYLEIALKALIPKTIAKTAKTTLKIGMKYKRPHIKLEIANLEVRVFSGLI